MKEKLVRGMSWGGGGKNMRKKESWFEFERDDWVDFGSVANSLPGKFLHIVKMGTFCISPPFF